jgi:Uma2 family endonuclease
MVKYYGNNVITATEFKLNLGKYLDLMSEKKEFVITKNNKKIARITPYITEIEDYFTVKEEARDYVYGGKKVSYEEFMEIYDNSTLRMEFINGEIIIMGSPSSFHQDILGFLYMIFREFFLKKQCKVFLAPFDVHFHKKGLTVPDVMQPDIVVACDYKDTIDEKGKYMGIPSLVVEILSPSTRSRDMVDKLNTFMLSGVMEYWIIDIRDKKVIMYTFKENGIDNMKTFSQGETIESCNFKDLKCSVEELFKSIE